jgi:hypothetical protein
VTEHTLANRVDHCTCSTLQSRHSGDDWSFACRTCLRTSPSDCTVTPGGAGVEGADFLVYVTATATADCSGATLAYASSCQRDLQNWYVRSFGSAAPCFRTSSGMNHSWKVLPGPSWSKYRSRCCTSSNLVAYRCRKLCTWDRIIYPPISILPRMVCNMQHKGLATRSDTSINDAQSRGPTSCDCI